VIPALVIGSVGGRRRRIPVLLPIFVLWPFTLLGYGALWLLSLVRSRRSGWDRLAMMRLSLASLFHLSGLRIEVDSSEGPRFRLWLL